MYSNADAAMQAFLVRSSSCSTLTLTSDANHTVVNGATTSQSVASDDHPSPVLSVVVADIERRGGIHHMACSPPGIHHVVASTPADPDPGVRFEKSVNQSGGIPLSRRGCRAAQDEGEGL